MSRSKEEVIITHKGEGDLRQPLVTKADFKLVENPYDEFLLSKVAFECECGEFHEPEMYLRKEFDINLGEFGDMLIVQWNAFDRVFRATFVLGPSVEVAKSELSYANGVVTLSIPRRPECVAKKIYP